MVWFKINYQIIEIDSLAQYSIVNVSNEIRLTNEQYHHQQQKTTKIDLLDQYQYARAVYIHVMPFKFFSFLYVWSFESHWVMWKQWVRPQQRLLLFP